MDDSEKTAFKEKLESRFSETWQRCLLPGISSSPAHAWNELAYHYSQDNRLYHTLDHIAFCLQQFDAAKHLISSPDAVEMAVWYHDVINNPNTRNNEHQSQLMFELAAQDIFDHKFVKNVSSLIMITTHRDTPNSADEEYICDIDLSSMGLDWEKFILDSNALRAESASSPEEYTLGKLKFFNTLLQRPRIFYTDFFYSRFENDARSNIQRYIAILNRDG